MESDDHYKLPNPFIFCTKLISLQAEIVSTCIFNAAAPFFSLISLVSGFFQTRPKEEDDDLEPISRGGGGLLLGRIAAGLLAAAYVCVVLMVLMVVAAVLGFGVVRAWAEQPLYVGENLQFDYRDAHPTALFSLGGGVPVGHTLYVCLVLLMPESDYNREVGIFQLTAELLSFEQELIAKSSHPCMLQFRSWAVRLARTFMMGVPLLLGITTETQRITFPILKHTEAGAGYPRTEHVRITLTPRAGTSYLPQFYDAQLLIRSRPPWIKELVYRWKWTFCVWTTMHIFIMLLMIVLVFLLILSSTPFFKIIDQQGPAAVEVAPQLQPPLLGARREEREVSESLRRWQRSRSKRKAALLHGHKYSEGFDSSASSITVSQGERESGLNYEESSGDSDSSSVSFR